MGGWVGGWRSGVRSGWVGGSISSLLLNPPPPPPPLLLRTTSSGSPSFGSRLSCCLVLRVMGPRRRSPSPPSPPSPHPPPPPPPPAPPCGLRRLLPWVTRGAAWTAGVGVEEEGVHTGMVKCPTRADFCTHLRGVASRREEAEKEAVEEEEGRDCCCFLWLVPPWLDPEAERFMAACCCGWWRGLGLGCVCEWKNIERRRGFVGESLSLRGPDRPPVHPQPFGSHPSHSSSTPPTHLLQQRARGRGGEDGEGNAARRWRLAIFPCLLAQSTIVSHSDASLHPSTY